MKIFKPSSYISLSFLFIFFISVAWAQTQPAPQPAPAPAPAPSPQPAPAPAPQPNPQPAPQPAPSPTPQQQPPPSSTKTEIPIIKMGDQIKPEGSAKPEKTVKPEKTAKPEKTEKVEKQEKPVVEKEGKTTKTERPKKAAAPKEVKVEEKGLVVEARQMVHSKQAEVGQPVLFTIGEGPAKGALVLGKITEIQRMEKDQPGRLKINLESVMTGGAMVPLSGTIEVVREKGKDDLGGKEVFMMVGYKQPISVPKKFSLKAAPAASTPKAKKGKVSGPVTALAGIEDGSIEVRVAQPKYPAKLNIYIEPPSGMKLADLNEDSIRLVRVNDVVLPKPIGPTPEKIKVADHDKNNVQELNYKFDGWEIIQFLPQGGSTLVFAGTTKDGRPLEAMGKVTVEYR